MTKLNLGCGHRKLPKEDGWVNVDCEAICEPDIVFDIASGDWALYWERESIEEIVAAHVLEHIQSFKHVMQECYRVLVPEGNMTIVVPHHLSDDFWGDPTHVRAITINQMLLLDQERNRMTIAKGWANTPLGIYWGVNFHLWGYHLELTEFWQEKRKAGLSDDALDHAIQSYHNVVKEVTLKLRKCPIL